MKQRNQEHSREIERTSSELLMERRARASLQQNKEALMDEVATLMRAMATFEKVLEEHDEAKVQTDRLRLSLLESRHRLANSVDENERVRQKLSRVQEGSMRWREMYEDLHERTKTGLLKMRHKATVEEQMSLEKQTATDLRLRLDKTKAELRAEVSESKRHAIELDALKAHVRRLEANVKERDNDDDAEKVHTHTHIRMGIHTDEIFAGVCSKH